MFKPIRVQKGCLYCLRPLRLPWWKVLWMKKGRPVRATCGHCGREIYVIKAKYNVVVAYKSIQQVTKASIRIQGRKV